MQGSSSAPGATQHMRLNVTQAVDGEYKERRSVTALVAFRVFWL